MKSTKLILSAVILASLAACTASDGAKKQRDFCYKFDKFENICLDGDHASSDVKSQDKSTPDRSDDPPKKWTITAATTTTIITTVAITTTATRMTAKKMLKRIATATMAVLTTSKRCNI